MATNKNKIFVTQTMSPGARALLNERDGVLVRLKARLAGAQQVVTKPLVQRHVVALVSAYLCQKAPTRQ